MVFTLAELNVGMGGGDGGGGGGRGVHAVTCMLLDVHLSRHHTCNK